MSFPCYSTLLNSRKWSNESPRPAEDPCVWELSLLSLIESSCLRRSQSCKILWGLMVCILNTHKQLRRLCAAMLASSLLHLQTFRAPIWSDWHFSHGKLHPGPQTWFWCQEEGKKQKKEEEEVVTRSCFSFETLNIFEGENMATSSWEEAFEKCTSKLSSILHTFHKSSESFDKLGCRRMPDVCLCVCLVSLHTLSYTCTRPWQIQLRVSNPSLFNQRSFGVSDTQPSKQQGWVCVCCQLYLNSSFDWSNLSHAHF